MTAEVTYWSADGGAAPCVSAVAAWNGLGFSAHQVWAFRRAALSAMAATPFCCPNGFRATMAHIRTLPPKAVGAERMVPVLRSLVRELAPRLAPLPDDARVAVWLCLGERFADGYHRPRYAGQRRVFEAAVRDALGPRGALADVTCVPRGHAALAFALQDAGRALASRAADVALVGGVDTYYDPDVVEDLLAAGRLFDGENLDSMIPGEGGAFCVLAPPATARALALEAPLRVDAAVTSAELASMFADRPCIGAGLSRAVRAVADRLAAEKQSLGWWLGDVTPETYRVREFQAAFARGTVDVAGDGLAHEFLPPLLGDLGAATLPTALAIAHEAFLRGDPDVARALLVASSTTEDRGVVLVSRRT